ncbi:MAG: hypothetical protein KBG28_25355 [Kofleriaceae bacterium]|nr:hypothetical protein [Kofleriaceae bacterium]
MRTPWLLAGVSLVLAATHALPSGRADEATTPAASAPTSAPAPAGPPTPRPNRVRVDHHAADAAPTLGPASAAVTVELFIVPGAANSRAPFELLRDLQQAHPSRLRLVVRPLGRDRINAAEAALEAQAQGRFFTFFELLGKQRGVSLSRDRLAQLAAQVGMDVDRLHAAWADDRHDATLASNEGRRMRLHAGSPPDALFAGQPTPRPLSSLTREELEELYQAAYTRAVSADPAAGTEPDPDARPDLLLVPGPIDDDAAVGVDEPGRLLRRPLPLDRWPSVGPDSAPATIAVLCNLRRASCQRQLALATAMRAVFEDQLRVVWGPAFDLDGDDAAELTLLHDAALCGHSLGVGWTWVEQALTATQRRRGDDSVAAEIEAVRTSTEVDPAAFASCRARRAGASAWVVASQRAAGVTVAPTVIVGGRAYPGGVADARMLQMLVEDELAPGALAPR